MINKKILREAVRRELLKEDIYQDVISFIGKYGQNDFEVAIVNNISFSEIEDKEWMKAEYEGLGYFWVAKFKAWINKEHDYSIEDEKILNYILKM